MLNKLRLERRFNNFMALTISLLFLLAATPSIAADTQTIPWTHLNYDVCGTGLYGSIDGNIIAFSGYGVDENGTWYGQLGYHDIAANKTEMLPFEGFYPSISGTKIAFRENIWGPSNIKIYDISTKTILDTGIIDYSYRNYGNRYYDDGVLLFVDANSSLKFIDFNTSKQGSTGIAVGNWYYNYTIDNGHVTYSINGGGRWGGDEAFNVYYYSIKNTSLKNLGTGSDAQVFGDRIVWTEKVDPQYWSANSATVKIYNLKNGQIESHQIPLNGHYWTSYASGGFLLQGDYLIYTTDLFSPINIYNIKSRQVREYNIEGVQRGICCIIGVSGNYVIFDVNERTEDINYNCDLGYAYLPLNLKDSNGSKTNHGQYVSSIAKSTESGPGKSETVKEAARSMVGMPECSNKK